MTWLLLSGIWWTRGKPRTGFLPLREKRDRVRLSLEQRLNAANDREGHCTTESLRDARGLRPVRVQMGRNRWLSLDRCWSPFAAVLADWWIDVVGWYSLLLDSFGYLPWFDFSLESELVFLAERSLLRSRMGFPYR